MSIARNATNAVVDSIRSEEGIIAEYVAKSSAADVVVRKYLEGPWVSMVCILFLLVSPCSSSIGLEVAI